MHPDSHTCPLCQASPAQTLELLEEGIPVLALPATATDTLH